MKTPQHCSFHCEIALKVFWELQSISEVLLLLQLFCREKRVKKYKRNPEIREILNYGELPRRNSCLYVQFVVFTHSFRIYLQGTRQMGLMLSIFSPLPLSADNTGRNGWQGIVLLLSHSKEAATALSLHAAGQAGFRAK